MNTWTTGRRPITIAILAMGGEGGGVLADWIVSLGEDSGFITQSTSVAGVAQRTGATVYYVELFPRSDAAKTGSARTEPVLSLFPTPGEVDVVIASELMEAGRALQRGFCTPDRTTLIASTNRVFAITEKIALGDGRVDDESLIESARLGSKRLIATDFSALAAQAGSVISSSLFGALAGSGALPIPRERFEESLKRSGKAVERSLKAFGLGFEAAEQAAAEALAAAEAAAAPTPQPTGLGPVRVTIGRRRPRDPEEEASEAAERRHAELATSDPRALVGPRIADRMDRVADFAEPARSMVVHGCVRTALYQSADYTDLFLNRTARVIPFDAERGADDPAVLSLEVARHTALWMAYQDTIHVAMQKLRKRRMEGVRVEAKAESGQLTQIREFLHPQVDEITDTLPTGLGRALSRSKLFEKVVGKITRDGMIVNTTSVVGSSMLRFLVSLRPMRPRSLRYGREQIAIDAWLDLIVETAATDYDLACEIAKSARVLKGYGQTHAHGSESFTRLMAAVPELAPREDAAKALARLSKAALADEDGAALGRELRSMQLTVA
ncbi:indolepyruvate oxidoreductase subunit beta family protein [Leucobacter luti]|uniref:Indolepyruvate ferredoxin oxidoreductase beta subunit n=1 Tax=Leucobacter luti TaxID=340320 RepID=A0A4Q7TY75_9MICO|nr:indolepyruvate oxidoreductase subunit beta family protein [Leucobacter luti]MBL3698784.1 indolepyruvate oxidoreductase subunit beta family protein [Leucobacter luti]RZT66161.1 indolepyruvate ferredoxin oxidoreductase beta subunit [Leucobacter luti]